MVLGACGGVTRLNAQCSSIWAFKTFREADGRINHKIRSEGLEALGVPVKLDLGQEQSLFFISELFLPPRSVYFAVFPRATPGPVDPSVKAQFPTFQQHC